MNFNKHPSYIGYADEMSKDNRLKQWEEQYNSRGFDDTVTWSLDFMIAKFIAPRLKRYIEISKEMHDADDFHKELDKMLAGFELYISKDFNEFNEDHIAKVNESFEILAKEYRGLWW